MKLFLFLMCLLPASLFAAPSKDVKPIVIGVIDAESKAGFEEKILPLLKAQIVACSVCEIKNFSPYDENGQFNVKKLASQLEEASTQTTFLFLGWNTRMSSEHTDTVEQLKKIVASGTMVVGEAGLAPLNTDSAPLSRTVLGQVPDLVIVGEITEKERLLLHSYYGPEMLTAVRPPNKEHIGLGLGPVYFVSKLAVNWTKRSVTEWLSHFKSTKSKSRRIWPELEDFFR